MSETDWDTAERRHPPGPCVVEKSQHPFHMELRFANNEYVTIAGDTQSLASDEALANRLAVCFNSLEGVPSENVAEVVRLGLESFLRVRTVKELDRRKAVEQQS